MNGESCSPFGRKPYSNDMIGNWTNLTSSILPMESVHRAWPDAVNSDVRLAVNQSTTSLKNVRLLVMDQISMFAFCEIETFKMFPPSTRSLATKGSW